MKQVTIQEFHAILKAQEQPTLHLAFRCPVCDTIQSAADLIAAGAGPDIDAVEGFLAFSCLGRFTSAGPFKEETTKAIGCDWTLGGLFRLHKFEVVDETGKAHPRFEPATPEEAQLHRMTRYPESIPTALAIRFLQKP